MAEKEKRVYPQGIMTFAKNENAPDFVVGDMVLNIQEFTDWLNGEGSQYITEYKGKEQIRFSITTYNGRPSLSVNTFKPSGNR